MTPVETIRKAAALMRERAQAARPGPWTASDSGYVAGPVGSCNCAGGTPEASYMHEPYCGYEPVADTGCSVDDPDGPPPDAAHIASWHPQVALAVADWLEHDATRIERRYGKEADEYLAPGEPSLAVARAYLGGAS